MLSAFAPSASFTKIVLILLLVSPSEIKPKPFSFAELEARVRALTRRGMGAASTVIRHGALEYDQAGRVARISGHLVELSARELALEAGVNPNTMQRAFSELERDGLVYTQRTSGRFVTEDEEVLRNLRKNLSRDFIEEMCTRLIRLGMSTEEIRDAVEAWAARREEQQ